VTEAPVSVEQLLTSATHAMAQVESIIFGCERRTDRIEQAKTQMDEIYGSDLGRTIGLVCAHGADNDARTALSKAYEALKQEIEHLQSAKPSPL
jgi:hypothetical protein